MVEIDAWRIIGPMPLKQQTYDATEEQRVMNMDMLSEIGGSEVPLKIPLMRTAVPINFDHDIYDEVSITGSKDGSFLCQDVVFPGGIVTSQNLFWHTFEAFKILYAASVVTSDRERDVVLLLSGNSPIKTWVNDKLIAQSAPGSVGHDPDFRQAATVHLLKGSNTILIKEFCFPLRNNFVVRIATLSEFDKFVREHKFLEDVMDEIIVNQEDGLVLSENLRTLVEKTPEVIVSKLTGKIVAQGKIDLWQDRHLPLPALEPGLYALHIRTKLGWASEHFVAGSVAQVLESYKGRCAGPRSEILGYDPCIIIKPLEDLVRSSGRSRRLDHEKQIMMLMSQLEWALDGVTPERQIFDERRFQLMRVTGNGGRREQYFYLFLPDRKMAEEKLPLVVMLASHPERHPFLRSGPTMAIDALRRYSTQADRFGYAVVVPFLREPHESEQTAKNVLALVANLRSRYSIDPDRIYLSGDCEDGRAALLMAERSPHTFAAIAIGRPATGGVTEKTGDVSIDEANPLLKLNMLKGIPIRAVHGDYFPHSPTYQSILLQQQAAALGIKVDLVLMPRDGELAQKDMMAEQFSFFKDKRRKPQAN